MVHHKNKHNKQRFGDPNIFDVHNNLAAKHQGIDIKKFKDYSFTFEGGSTAVLLIHGLTGTPSEMKGIGKAISKHGFTVHGVQLSGHCGDEQDLIQTGWRDWNESVETAFDCLRKYYRTVFVGGLSMGALLSLNLGAARQSQVAGLLLYSTTLFYDGWAIPKKRIFLKPALALGFAGLIRFEENFPFGLKNTRTRERISRFMLRGDSSVAGNVATPGKSLVQLEQLISRTKRILPKVRTPTLVMHARDDDMSSLRNANYVVRNIGGNVEKVILENSYHMLTLDNDRDELVKRSVSFMRRVSE
jgi:carboxylesterase